MKCLEGQLALLRLLNKLKNKQTRYKAGRMWFHKGIVMAMISAEKT